MSTTVTDHAVVLGGSMAGLVAARALAERFARVTLVERDRFPAPGEPRKGVPQGRHAHALLASGCDVLEHYFPGLVGELAARGAPVADPGRAGWLDAGDVRFTPCDSGLRFLMVSRPLLEGHVRERLRATGRVTFLDGCDVLGLVGEGDRVAGARLLRRVDGSAEECLPADLVVDATGRGSRAPAWLEALGFAPPAEERVRVGVSYTTCLYRRRPGQLGGRLGAVVSAVPPSRRSGVAIAQEDDRWIVTLAGLLGERAPATHEGMIDYARGLPTPEIGQLLREAEPLGPPVTATYPFSQRRRYERLRRFPDGMVVVGDGVCSFNPIFGQGMSVAALEARALEGCLARGVRGVAPRFFAAAARIIDNPWSIAVGSDLRFPEVEGVRPPGHALVQRYLARVQRAAAADPAAARAFLRVVHLVDAPAALFAPGILWRALRAAPAPRLNRAATTPYPGQG